MNKQEIELVKYRDFSDVFNGSFAFMSQELKQLIRVFGLYAGVPVIISVILSALYMQDTFSTIFETINNGGAPVGGPNPVLILLTIIVSFVAQVFIMGLVPAYLGEYEDKGRDGFTAADVWNRFARHFGAIIGYSIVAGFLMFIGFLFLIIPGIYLWVPFSFVLYVKVIEDKDSCLSDYQCCWLVVFHPHDDCCRDRRFYCCVGRRSSGWKLFGYHSEYCFCRSGAIHFVSGALYHYCISVLHTP
jgi:hypothetical protein